MIDYFNIMGNIFSIISIGNFSLISRLFISALKEVSFLKGPLKLFSIASNKYLLSTSDFRDCILFVKIFWITSFEFSFSILKICSNLVIIVKSFFIFLSILLLYKVSIISLLSNSVSMTTDL